MSRAIWQIFQKDTRNYNSAHLCHSAELVLSDYFFKTLTVRRWQSPLRFVRQIREDTDDHVSAHTRKNNRHNTTGSSVSDRTYPHNYPDRRRDSSRNHTPPQRDTQCRVGYTRTPHTRHICTALVTNPHTRQQHKEGIIPYNNSNPPPVPPSTTTTSLPRWQETAPAGSCPDLVGRSSSATPHNDGAPHDGTRGSAGGSLPYETTPTMRQQQH